MKLNEFFRPSNFHDRNSDENSINTIDGTEEKEKLKDELYYYILDHDNLHKECFLPIAREAHEQIKNKKLNKEEFSKKLKPMINKACVEYYKKEKMVGDIKEIFTKEMRNEICSRLVDQSIEDIEKDEYKLD